MGFLRRGRKQATHPPAGSFRTYSVHPPGWPDAQLRGVTVRQMEYNLAVDLNQAKVGKILDHPKMKVSVRFFDKDNPPDDFNVNPPMAVLREDGTIVPIIVFPNPFGEEIRQNLIAISLWRAHTKIRHSPVAMYARYPIPDLLRYHLEGSRAALLESQATIIGALLPPTPTWAGLIEPTIRELFGIELDIDEHAFALLDGVLKELHWGDMVTPSRTTSLMLGFLAGNIISQLLGASWIGAEQRRLRLAVTSHTDSRGYVEVDIVGRIARQIIHGQGYELEPLFISLRDGTYQEEVEMTEWVETGPDQ